MRVLGQGCAHALHPLSFIMVVDQPVPVAPWERCISRSCREHVNRAGKYLRTRVLINRIV